MIPGLLVTSLEYQDAPTCVRVCATMLAHAVVTDTQSPKQSETACMDDIVIPRKRSRVLETDVPPAAVLAASGGVEESSSVAADSGAAAAPSRVVLSFRTSRTASLGFREAGSIVEVIAMLP